MYYFINCTIHYNSLHSVGFIITRPLPFILTSPQTETMPLTSCTTISFSFASLHYPRAATHHYSSCNNCTLHHSTLSYNASLSHSANLTLHMLHTLKLLHAILLELQHITLNCNTCWLHSTTLTLWSFTTPLSTAMLSWCNSPLSTTTFSGYFTLSSWCYNTPPLTLQHLLGATCPSQLQHSHAATHPHSSYNPFWLQHHSQLQHMSATTQPPQCSKLSPPLLFSLARNTTLYSWVTPLTGSQDLNFSLPSHSHGSSTSLQTHP